MNLIPFFPVKRIKFVIFIISSAPTYGKVGIEYKKTFYRMFRRKSRG